MSMSKFTPGPWIVGVSQDTTTGWPCFRLSRLHNLWDTQELEADANLISAAPDLLAACKELLDIEAKDSKPCLYDDCVFCKAVKQARAAIGKAEGEGA